MLPTGNVQDIFDDIKATCIDVGNPCVFVLAQELGVEGTILPDELEANLGVMDKLEGIRRQAAVAMGLCSELSGVPGSIPKIAMLAPVGEGGEKGKGRRNGMADLVVRALSVGQPHRAVPVTVAMAVAAAVGVERSVVSKVIREGRIGEEGGVTIAHPSGTIVVGSTWNGEGCLVETKVFRTARRLMEGWVYWK